MDGASTEEKLPDQTEQPVNWVDLRNDLQRIDEDIMAWTNALFQRNTDTELKLQDKVYKFRLLPFSCLRSAEGQKPALVADISTSKHKFKIALHDISAIAFFSTPELMRAPPDMLCIIFEFYLDEFLSAIEHRLGSPIKIDAVFAAPETLPACDHELYFGLTEISSGYHGIGSFLLDRDALAWFAQIVTDTLPSMSIPEYGDLPVLIEIIGVETKLSFQQVRDLEIGDIILDPIAPYGVKKRPLTVKVQRRTIWQCNTCDDGYVITTRVEAKVEDQKKQIPPAQQNSTDLDSLEMDLDFVLGSLTMPLSELRSVGEGYVFEIGKTMDKYLTVYANGRPIAKGELVRMGRRLGARVVELLLTKS